MVLVGVVTTEFDGFYIIVRGARPTKAILQLVQRRDKKKVPHV